MKLSQEHPHVYEFLKSNHMGILSTVTEEGKPWGSAIFFVVDEDFNIFFVTRMETFKYQNMDKNSYAALTVADHETLTTVQLSGKITRVPAENYMDVIFNKLAAIEPKGKSDWTPPLMKVHKGDYIPLQLTPSTLQYADYSTRSSDIDHEYIEKII